SDVTIPQQKASLGDHYAVCSARLMMTSEAMSA
ncbi:MAG: hypothetical protein ACI9Y8_001744, partial [Candidatus Omnitrophota bacterium]